MSYQEEIRGMLKKPKGKLIIDGREADLKLHSDMALGYNQALKDILPVIERAVMEAREQAIAEAIEEIGRLEHICTEDCYCNGYPPCEYEIGYSDAITDAQMILTPDTN